MIYFMRAGVTLGPVKIGFTKGDPEERRKTLQAGNAHPLYILAAIPGDIAKEQRLHERFAIGRLTGEWFAHDTPGLQEFLSDAMHFEGFFPEDQESLSCQAVLNA